MAYPYDGVKGSFWIKVKILPNPIYVSKNPLWKAFLGKYWRMATSIREAQNPGKKIGTRVLDRGV